MNRTKYELVGLDNNKTYGNNCLGIISPFDFDGEVFYFATMRSSLVKSISVSSDLMLVQTQNTLYTFKKQG